MKRVFIYILKRWWAIAIFTLIAITAAFYAITEQVHVISGILAIVAIVGHLFLLSSIIYQAYNRKILTTILSIVSLIICVGAFLVTSYVSFLVDQSAPDEFAKNISIPTDIKVEEPLNKAYHKNQRDSLEDITFTKRHFQLYHSFQTGLYEYDIWVDKIEKGIIYLRAYEVTKNLALSASRLKEQSTVHVKNDTEQYIRFGSKDHFTIYEGDWGDPYAARFEVWFKPDNGNTERKLFEKNYIIEGWMR